MKRTRRCLALLLALLMLLAALPVSGLAAAKVKTLKQSTWYTAQDPESGSFTAYKLKLTKESIVYISWKNAGADLDANACFCKDTECSEVLNDIYPYDRATGKEGIVLFPGTYYIRLSDTSKQAKFKFTTKKASALSSKNTSSKKATSLKAGKKAEMVFDTKNQKARWYKIKLTKKQIVRITTNPRFYAFQLFNSKLKEVPIYECENWVYSTKKKLAKGTYYVKARGEASSEYGLYQCFSWK